MKPKKSSRRIITLALGVIILTGSGNVFSQESETINNDVTELRFKGLTFRPGYRIQTRYAFYESSNTNDIMIRRLRIKAKIGRASCRERV